MKVMNTKLRHEFSFNYPLTHSVVRNLKIVNEKVGDLTVEGTGYYNPYTEDIDNQYQVDIDFVKWNGTDIKQVLDVLGAMDEIEIAAEVHLFDVVKAQTETVA